MAEIELELTLEERQALQALTKLTRKTSDFGSKSTKSFKDTTSAFDVFQGTLASGIALKAIEALSTASRELFNVFVRDGIAASQRQEDAVNQLNVALRQSGQFTREASESIQQFASSLQQSTIFGDEVIIQQVALAKNFGLTNEQAQDLVAAAVDLSAATGITLESSVRNLGKTFSGLTGELGEALPQIRGLTKQALQSGEAVRVIQREFGGFASKTARTFSGAIQQTGNSFGDLQESIGDIITQNPAIIAAVNELSSIFIELKSSVNDNEDGLKSFIEEGLFVTAEALVFTSEAVDPLIRSMRILFNVSTVTAKGVGNAFALVTDTLGITSDASKEVSKSVIEDLNDIKEAATETGLASAFADQINEFKQRLQERTEAVRRSRQQEAEVNREFDEADAERRLEKRIKEAEAEEQIIIERQERIDRLRELDEQGFANEISNLEKQQQQELSKSKSQSDKLIAVKRRQYEIFDKLDQQRLQATAGFFSNLSAISAFGGETNFKIAKSAATAEAIVQGALAVQKALAAAPPPFNFALAASVGLKTAANIRTIQAQALQTGIDSVPGIGTRDNFPAILAPGERVVPAKTNQDLTEFLESSGETNALLRDISSKLSQLNPVSIVNIDGQQVLTSVNDAIARGGRLAV